MEARLQVQKIRKKWTDWDKSNYPDDEEEDISWCKCCCFKGLTKEHFEAFLYWAVYCCWDSRIRSRSGRSDIAYTAYRPLRNIDSAHGLDSSHGGSNRGSDHGSIRSSSSHGGSSHGQSQIDDNEEEGKDDHETGSSSSDDDDEFEIGNAEEGYGKDAWYATFFGAGGGGTNSQNNSSHGNARNSNDGTDGVMGDSASNPLHPGSGGGSSQGGSMHGHGGSSHGGSSHGRGSGSSHGRR